MPRSTSGPSLFLCVVISVLAAAETVGSSNAAAAGNGVLIASRLWIAKLKASPFTQS